MALPSTTIDPRAYEQLVNAVRLYRLAEIDPMIGQWLTMMHPTRSSVLDARLFVTLQERVQAIIAGLQDRPFLPPPLAMTEGDVIIGLSANTMPVRVAWRDLASHALITAQSGGGKTNYLHLLLLQALHAGIKVWILDAKDDARYLATRSPFILFPALRYNPLERPAFMSPGDHIGTIITCFARAFFGHEQTKNLMNEALHELYRANDAPSMADLKRQIDEQYTPKLTFGQREANRSVSAKLQRAQDAYPLQFHTNRGVPFTTIAEGNVYFPVALLTEVDEFLWSVLVHQLFYYQRYHQRRGRLDYLLSIDEALLTFGNDTTSATNSRISGPTLGALHGMTREFGIGMLFTVLSIKAATPTIKTSSFLQAAMSVSDGSEADEITRTFGLTKEQREYHQRRLQTGEVIVRAATDRWRYPMLLTHPRIDPAIKNVTNEEWQDAIQRTKALWHDPLPPAITTAQAPPPPKPRDEHPSTTLGIADEALLRAICNATMLTTTEAYAAARLPAQVGDRAMKKMVGLGFVQRDAVAVRPGRGGTAMILQLTNAGYHVLREHAPHGPRGGGSPQHAFLITRLAQLITARTKKECLIETMMGGTADHQKSVDLCFTVTPDHEPVLGLIASNADHLTTDPYQPTHGDVVAIEIETGPDTVVNNATKNLAVGIALNITATMPKAHEQAKRRLLEELGTEPLRRVVLVDALTLLHELQQTTKP